MVDFGIEFSDLHWIDQSGAPYPPSVDWGVEKLPEARDVKGDLKIVFDGNTFDFGFSKEGIPKEHLNFTYYSADAYFLLFGLVNGILDTVTGNPQQALLDETMDAPEFWFKKTGDKANIWFVYGLGTINGGNRFGDHEVLWSEFINVVLSAAHRFLQRLFEMAPLIAKDISYVELSSKVAQLERKIFENER